MKLLGTARRYWHTLRHLRPVQLYGRAWFRLARPRPDERPAPERRKILESWHACKRPQRQFGPARFRFIGLERELDWPSGWHDRGTPKLWRYNLHYFDDLVAVNAPERKGWHERLISSWIKDNPPIDGDGWEPYPTSLRIVNWIKWAWSGSSLSTDAVESLAVQTRWLTKRLEHHLLGNHLWANAKALVFSGCYFSGEEADRWRVRGLALIERELKEQILGDGGHFERSPMYHAIVLEDVLDLTQLCRLTELLIPAVLEERLRSAAISMLDWLSEMSHPDGEIAFFNDAAMGIAVQREHLVEYAEVLGIRTERAVSDPLKVLDESGYVRAEVGPWRLLADVGPIGPDYLPGHAHADTLSFELTLSGKRLIVNSGIDRYEPGPERLKQRGTRAHSTVEVNGVDSSEVWSSFRVARRARPIKLKVHSRTSPLQFSCAHDGYLRLPGRVGHSRRWRLDEKSLLVEDRLSGQFDRAVARFYLHPDYSATVRGDQIIATHAEMQVRIDVQGGQARLMDTLYHPEFGKRVPNQCVELTIADTECRTEFCFEPQPLEAD